MKSGKILLYIYYTPENDIFSIYVGFKYCRWVGGIVFCNMWTVEIQMYLS